MESTPPPDEHKTETQIIYTDSEEGVAFRAYCLTCGWEGRWRVNKFDAGEDEIAHHDTGAGPRTREQMIREGR